MKQCPRCNLTYSDDRLNFCLDDGELLMAVAREPPPTRYSDDTPPTVILNDVRRTNPSNWPSSSPASSPMQWQGQQANMQNPQYLAPFAPSRDQTLPTISLVLGILSVILICCYGGIWLGLPAAIIGFLGMKNADNDPNRYGGRGMAIGGMVMGIISFASLLIMLLIWGISLGR